MHFLMCAMLALFWLLPQPATADLQSDIRVCDDQSGNSEQVIAACSRIIAGGQIRGTDRSVAYQNRGLLYLEKQEFDRAIADFNESIRFDPNSFKGYGARADAWLEQKNYDRAIADFNQVIRLNPKYDYSYFGRGKAYRKKGEYDKAIQDFDQAIRLNPRDSDYYVQRAYAYGDKNDKEKELQNFLEALKIDPNNADALIDISGCYIDLGKFDLAIEHATRALGIPNGLNTRGKVGAYKNRGEAYARKKDYDRALSDFSEAIKSKPDGFESNQRRADVYYLTGKYDQALADYEKLIELDSKAGDGLYGRGLVKLKKGDVSGGEVDIRAAKALEADIAEQFSKRDITR